MLHLRWYTPAIYGCLAIIFLQYSGADSWIASQIYALNQGWSWQNSWLLEKVLHKGGRSLVAVILVSLIFTTVVSFIFRLFSPILRLALLYSVVASLFSILVISGLKQITLLPCPWDVQGLGGDQAYLYLHQLFSSREAGRQCFPAGHASGGYALFSLYFAAVLVRTKHTRSTELPKVWLIPALLLGLILGIAQQFRGAHFLSHDITTALLCWYCCRLVWFTFDANLKPKPKTHSMKLSKFIFSSSAKATMSTNRLAILEKVK